MKTKIIELLKRAKQNILEILPGLIVCVIIAGISQVIAHFVPTVGAALFAIALGRKPFVRVFHCTDRFHTKFNRYYECRLARRIIHYSANDFDHCYHVSHRKITPFW